MIHAGKCDLALMNVYYHPLMMDNPEQRPWAEGIGVFYPDQRQGGAFIMRSAVGLTKASRNVAAATQLMEFLAGKDGQNIMTHLTYQFPHQSRRAGQSENRHLGSGTARHQGRQVQGELRGPEYRRQGAGSGGQDAQRSPVRQALSETGRARWIPPALPCRGGFRGYSGMPHILLLLALVVVVSAPGLYILGLGTVQFSPAWWTHLAETVLPQYLVDSLLVTGGATLVALVLGGLPAWLTFRHVFPGRAWCVFTQLLPLTLPAYVAAGLYMEAFTADFFYSRWALVMELGAAAAPLVFMFLRLALARLPANLFDTAASLGNGPPGALLAGGTAPAGRAPDRRPPAWWRPRPWASSGPPAGSASPP
jgi:ABC-type glycerol-3-phosphate transport system permease component